MYRTYLKQFIHLLLLAFMLVFPLSKGLTSVGYVSLLILSAARLDRDAFGSMYRKFGFGKLLLLLVVLLGISVFYSGPNGFDVLFSQKGLVVIPFVLWMNRDLIKKHWKLYFTIFLAGVALNAACVILFYALPKDQTAHIVGKLGFLRELPTTEKMENFGAYSPFIDRLHLSYMLAYALLISLWLSLSSNKKWMYYLLAGIPGITLLLLGGRGGQMAALAGGLIWAGGFLVKYISTSFKLSRLTSGLLVAVALVLGTAVMAQLAYKNVSAVSSRYDQMKWEIETYRNKTYKPDELYHYTTIRRWASWVTNLRLIGEKPLQGHGIGDYKKVMEAAYEKEDFGVPVHAHNQFFFYGVSAGILSMLVLVWLLVDWIRTTRQYFSGFAWAVLVATVVIFLLDAPLNYATGNILFTLILGQLYIVTILNKSLPDEVMEVDHPDI